MEFIAVNNQPAFGNMQHELRRELDPQGFLEEEVFHALVSAAWNRRRVLTFLAELDELGLDPLRDPAYNQPYDRLVQHEANHQREFFAALKELKELQASRTAPRPAKILRFPRSKLGPWVSPPTSFSSSSPDSSAA